MRVPFLVGNAPATGDYFNVRSPFDGSFVAEVERPDDTVMEKALENAVRYHSSSGKLLAWQRYEILEKVSKKISETAEELAGLIASEGGKPYTDALAEAKRAAVTVRLAAIETMKTEGEQIPMDLAAGSQGHLAFTMKEPVGPVLAISAFNHPVNLVCHQAATAIAAGCPVIIKPSEKTPVSAYKIVSYFLESGLPKYMMSFLPAGGEDIARIISDTRIAFVSFIGSSKVGWDIRKKVAPGTGVALEHGGTATAVVDESADIEKTVESLLKGAFYHAGQVCVSTQTIYAHKNIYQDFLRRFTERTGKIVTGDPLDPDTQVGPLISRHDRDRVLEWLDEAEKGGAEIVAGGKPVHMQSITPAVVTGVKESMSLFRKEVFGPVVNILPYRDLDEVRSKINSSGFMFQNCIFTGDFGKAVSFGRGIDTKSLIINDHTAFRVDWMPFGGGKDSGMGVGGVKYGVADLLSDKLFVVRTGN